MKHRLATAIVVLGGLSVALTVLTSARAVAATATQSCPSNTVCTASKHNRYPDFSCAPATDMFPGVPIYVIWNRCPTRVWLHQLPNHTGWSYCISPGAAEVAGGWFPGFRSYPVQYINPQSLQVSGNRNSC